MEGAKAIAAVPKDAQLSTLRCAPQSRAIPARTCQAPMTLLPFLARSLSDNAICGLNKYGSGTYTAEGITALCEGLKGSAVTSLT